MNLARLFETQRMLDDRIIKEKGLEGQDLLPMKILALQVELGELANEWRGFKFWSEDRKPRGQGTYLEYRTIDAGGNRWVTKNPLLEEYVDCLHFILSIGNEIGANEFLRTRSDWSFMCATDITAIFNTLFKVDWTKALDGSLENEYFSGFEYFMTLGEVLDFTWEEVEQAYYAKNEINHERQSTGY